jgi:transient receptor potential cation channel subfamily M protein 3
MPRGYQYSLIDIGLVINQLMGSGYASTYSRRKFRSDYYGLQSTAGQNNHLPPKSNPVVSFAPNGSHRGRIKPPAFLKRFSKSSLHSNSVVFNNSNSSPRSPRTQASDTGIGPTTDHTEVDDIKFEFPFSELVIWAVLTKRQQMAKLMWQHGEQAMAKALVACRLYQAMALEAADDDLDVEIYEELDRYSKAFEELCK